MFIRTVRPNKAKTPKPQRSQDPIIPNRTTVTHNKNASQDTEQCCSKTAVTLNLDDDSALYLRERACVPENVSHQQKKASCETLSWRFSPLAVHRYGNAPAKCSSYNQNDRFENTGIIVFEPCGIFNCR